MPLPSESEFGIKPRIDKQPGYRLIVPTKMSFVEADGSDVRMSRVKVYDNHGNLQHTYMLSPMGQRYKDLEKYLDGLEYLSKL